MLGIGLVACLVLALMSVVPSAPSRTAVDAELSGSAGVDAAANARRAMTAVPAAVRAAAQPPGGLVESANGYGFTEGSFSVSDDGSARYRVPLWMPEARGGQVAPGLALAYDSGAGNGSLGVGWRLEGLSSITPCARTFAIDGESDGVSFDGTDAYCLDGNRLLPQDTTGRHRSFKTEKETFARILGYDMGDGVPDSFKVWGKDGLIRTYGVREGDSGAQLRALKLKEVPGPEANPTLKPVSQTPVTVSWALNRIEDRNGNAATVEYEHFNGGEASLWHAELRPKRISYAPNRLVEFSYAKRTDPIDSFVGGVHTRTSERLSRIRMTGGPEGGKAEVLRDYDLGYHKETTTITGRSLLALVEERDQGGALKQPLSFSYSEGSYDYKVIETNVEVASADVKKNFRLTVGDVNGDGRDDILYPDSDNDWKMRFATDNQFGPELDAGIRGISPDEPARLYPTDVDRDGLMDAMAEIQDPGSPGHRKKLRLYMSDGEKFVPSPVDVDEGRADEDPDPAHFTDIDGNGTTDYLSATYGGTPWAGAWYYRLNTGKAPHARWGQTVETDETWPEAPANSSAEAVDLDGDGKGWVASGDYADLNGDGLQDRVHPGWWVFAEGPDGKLYRKYSLHARINSGNGFGARSDSPDGWKPPVSSGSSQRVIPGSVRYVDFDNDGADDLLVFHPSYHDDPPSQGTQLWLWRNGKFVKAPFAANVGFGTPNGMSTKQPFDFDGDGVLDIVYFEDDDDGDVDRDGHLKIVQRTGDKPDLLVRAGIEPNGQRVEFDYRTLASAVAKPGDCEFPQVCPRRGGTIVSQHRVANPEVEDGWARFGHSYEDARTDAQGRGSLGFAKHTVRGLDTGSTTTTEFDNATRDGGVDGESSIYPYAGLPAKVTTYVSTPDRPTYRKIVTNTYELRRLDSGGYTVELAKTVEDENELPAGQSNWPATMRSVETTFDYDDFGNQEEASRNVAGGRRTTTKTTFDNDEANWLIGMERQVTVTGCPFDIEGQPECETRETTFDYDEAGNLTETVVEPDGGADVYQKTTTDYGEAGEVRKVTVEDKTGEQRVDEFDYDDDLLHPTTTTNARGHTSESTYHSGLGVPLETKDANGVRTTMSYDKFGRLRRTSYADGGFDRIGHLSIFGGQVTTTTSADGSETVRSRDQLGREIVRRVLGFDGEWRRVFSTYNKLGLLESESRPSKSADPSPHKTTYEYDNRGRTTRVVDPDGMATSYFYDRLRSTTRDARGVEFSTEAGVDGDVVKRVEPDPASADGRLETTYTYGPFGELTETEAPDGSTQTMDYDVLGRRVDLDDPSAGVTETAYNGFGEVVSETNGADETTEFGYDELGRVDKVTSPDGTETRTWDTADHGKGQLAAAKSADGVVTSHTYDQFGRPASATWRIENQPYRIDYGYDEIGRQTGLTYPSIPGVEDRLEIVYGYNEHGYLQQVHNAADVNEVYWAGVARNAEGALTRERLGNGVQTDTGYDERTGLLSSVAAYGHGGDLIKMSLERDPVRNVAHRNDLASGRKESYSYDELNRLANWQVTDGDHNTNTTYDYDLIGNLKTETVAGDPARDVTYRYGQEGAPKHALTTRNTEKYAYDDAGRQVSGPKRTVEYNRFNLPTVLTWGAQPQRRTQYSYDADGARVRKHDTGPEGQTVTSVPGVFERRQLAGTDNREIHNLHNIVVEGRTVLQLNRVQKAGGGPIVATKPRYLHADHQGSILAVTNKAGQRVGSEEDGFLDELIYDPFGRRLDAENKPLGAQRRGGPRQGYDGLLHEDENSFIDMNGRIYDADARRFLTPDPHVTDPLNSQSLNRYSYVWNNPVNLTDPTGFDPDGGDEIVLEDKGGYGPGSAYLFGSGFGTNTVSIATSNSSSQSPSYLSKEDLAWWTWSQTLPGNESINVVGDPGRGQFDALAGSFNFFSWARELKCKGCVMPVGKLGFVDFWADDFRLEEPKFWEFDAANQTVSFATISGLLGFAEGSAEVSAAGWQLQGKNTWTGPGLSSGVKAGRDGFNVDAGVWLASATACVKACTPLVHICAEVCGGAKLGLGMSAGGWSRGGKAGFGVTFNKGLTEFGINLGFEGANQNVFNATSVSSVGKFHAVRDLVMNPW
jgi:RHS repeat-associated protein